jgi:hypothetical protein
MQIAGEAQSASAVHEFLQVASPHRYGKQEIDPGVTQVPAPSQVETAVDVVVAVGQVGALQTVPAV